MGPTLVKAAANPSVHLAPKLLEEVGQALEEGESLVAFVEVAVQKEVRRRWERGEFVRRGLAAIERSVNAGDGIPAEAVIARLEARLAAARRASAGR